MGRGRWLLASEESGRDVAQLDRRDGDDWTTVAWMASDANSSEPVTVMG